MRQLLCSIAFFAASPFPRADDKPKDDPKALDSQHQFDTLIKEFESQRAETLAKARQARGKEQSNLYHEATALTATYADKVYRLVEENPHDPFVTEALFWIGKNGATAESRKPAMKRLAFVIEDAQLEDLSERIEHLNDLGPEVAAAVLVCAKKEKRPKQAGDLLIWLVRTNPGYLEGHTAIELMTDKYPDHPGIDRMFQIARRAGDLHTAATLKSVRRNCANVRMRALATLTLGQQLVDRIDRTIFKAADEELAIEAEKYLSEAVREYGDSVPEVKSAVERGLNHLHYYRIGKTPRDIVANDLDGKEFKLSDFRGKVVLLDFWGSFVPRSQSHFDYDRELVRRLANKPFAVVGINSDTDLDKLRDVLGKEKITWRSFWNGPQGGRGPISTEWDVSSWPTKYLIDHKGVIRRKLVARTAETDKFIDQLVADAEQDGKSKP